MTHPFEPRMIENELDTLALRIEVLPAHPRYTDAGELVRKAKQAVSDAATDLHQREMKARFAKSSLTPTSDEKKD